MENKELNELKMMLNKIESMSLSSNKDALNIKTALMNLLKKISIKYQSLSLTKQNKDINSIIPELVSLFARIQGIDIVCMMGNVIEPSVNVCNNQITGVNHATDNAMATINNFNELEGNVCTNNFFTSSANAILIKK